MPARLAPQEDENDSPPTEGMAEGQKWVSSGESIPEMEPILSVRCGGRPLLRLEGILLGECFG
jgi:hypothetical protein